jgi:hypothetical protein
MTTTTHHLANVPHPPGATQVDDWCLHGGAARQFQGTLRQMPDFYGATHEFDVLTAGEQRRDGTVDRYISFGGYHLTPHQAMVVAANLTGAAAKSYQMVARDAGVPTEDQIDRTHQVKGVHRSISAILYMYPCETWSLEESMVVRAAMYEIALWRQRGHRGEQLEKAAADIARRERMRAITIAEGEARRRAAAAPCDLCDDDGRVLGRDGERVLDSDGYDLDCRHGRPVDLDDVDYDED